MGTEIFDKISVPIDSINIKMFHLTVYKLNGAKFYGKKDSLKISNIHFYHYHRNSSRLK